MEFKEISAGKLRDLKYTKKMLRAGHEIVRIMFDRRENVISKVEHVWVSPESPDRIAGRVMIPDYPWKQRKPYRFTEYGNRMSIFDMGSRLLGLKFTDSGLRDCMESLLDYDYGNYFAELYISDQKVCDGYFVDDHEYDIEFVRRWMVEHGYHIEDPCGLPGYSDLQADAVEKLRTGGECEYGCEKLCAAAQNLLMLSNEARRNGSLALEDAVERLGIARKCEPKEAAFLDEMAKLLADNYDPKWIVEIMTNEYLTFAPEGTMAMCLYFYIRGGLMILSGAANGEILRFLSFFLPKPWQGQFEEWMKEQGGYQ